ncbi:MAG: hypothetical protein LBS96_02165, partial [Oscillospiraceae bacterium]|nr:hypothetical protein [Oscillospiraceae bacterium]
KIWTLEGSFVPGNVLVAAKIDGDWGEVTELVPVPTLPGDVAPPPAGGGEGQGVIVTEPPVVEEPAAVGDPPTVDAELPTEGEVLTDDEETPAGEDAPVVDPAPAKKSFLQVLLEWLRGLFGLFG